MDQTNEQPTLETEQRLNDLDEEQSQQDIPSIPTAYQPSPAEAKEFCLIELPNGLKLSAGSSLIRADGLMEMLLQTKEHLDKTKGGTDETKTKSYLG